MVKTLKKGYTRDTLFDQKFPALLVMVADKGDRQQTEVSTHRLNHPKGLMQ